MFLLKAVFWLSLIILLIPAGRETGAAARGGVSPVEAFSAVRDVWDDFSTFCDRNEEACETGHRLAARYAEKAHNGGRMLYGFVVERFD